MHIAYFYLMTAEPARVRAAAPPATPRTGTGSRFPATAVARSPTPQRRHVPSAPSLEIPSARRGWFDQYWITEWLVDPDGSGQAARQTPDPATEEVRPQ
jgi:hypothetical protein